ncbi:phosphoribosylanthranilate isomerase [Daejeonella sp.]|uniref:phosphoribosylanthranilate isomerase n=1 Tax=Daejeonella sp. TaxID=2805397 RepID=UPI0027159736|nr:phosphoribosylanthranilate isomerase [Daejeonella sp.]MDO8993294.1 phosphoribosylanthranilate isomerase [Daejeonella sp.]MDP2414587.1 phosphoribosylanthranilate isomerase [Daejeonella sp.]
MKIKVCGMRDPQNILSLAELKPDYMGLIFYPKSKRYVADPDKNILASLPASISLTGVFVDEREEDVIKKVVDFDLSAVQLHGAESPEYCISLKIKLNEVLPDKHIELIKAFGVYPGFDFSTLEAYNEVVDYFLFDTKTSEHGGSGIAFDWTILDQYDGEKQFFLSGGLSPDNIDGLFNLATKKIYALDLNSRFETEPGLKNIDSLRSAFQLIRASKIS